MSEETAAMPAAELAPLGAGSLAAGEAQAPAGALSGVVVSAKADKTITVLVERRVKHKVYGKYLTRSRRLHAHDADNQCQEGDRVTIEASRPISKTKSWRLRSVDRKATIIAGARA